MISLEDLYRQEYGNFTMADIEEELAQEPSLEKVAQENQPTIQNIPQSAFERGLELAGIGLEEAATFLESLGSIEIAGVPISLRSLLPVDVETSKALKTAGSGMPLTVGGGLQTRLKPEFGGAATEVALATTLAKPIEKGVKSIGKAAMKNKAKIATGVSAMTAASTDKQKAK